MAPLYFIETELKGKNESKIMDDFILWGLPRLHSARYLQVKGTVCSYTGQDVI